MPSCFIPSRLRLQSAPSQQVEGGQSVACPRSFQKIELSTERVTDGMRVCVSNPGPAIVPEHLERIFERFYRVDEARSNSAGSTGLGLAMVRSIMELHQGRATAENREGLLRFCLFFPYRPRILVDLHPRPRW